MEKNTELSEFSNAIWFLKGDFSNETCFMFDLNYIFLVYLLKL